MFMNALESYIAQKVVSTKFFQIVSLIKLKDDPTIGNE